MMRYICRQDLTKGGRPSVSESCMESGSVILIRWQVAGPDKRFSAKIEPFLERREVLRIKE